MAVTPEAAQRLAAGLVDAAARANIPPSELDISLVRLPSGEHVVRIFSDEAFLHAIRQWDPERHGVAGQRPFNLDGPVAESMTLAAIPDLESWRGDDLGGATNGQGLGFETFPTSDRDRDHGPVAAETPLHRREDAAAPDAPPRGQPDIGPGGVPLRADEQGRMMPVDRTGYALREQDVAFIGADQPVAAFDQAAIDRWADGETPLGMPPELYGEWRESMRAALEADGIDPDEVDVRMKGSAAEFFSGPRKSMPTMETLAADLRDGRITQEVHDEAVRRLTGWLGEDGDGGPTARPFDTMYRLGLDDERSDYDLNFSSDVMFRRALARWTEEEFGGTNPDGSRLVPVRPADRNHGYLSAALVAREFPHLDEWAQAWSERLGRPMSYAVFMSRGPDDTTTRPGHAGVSVHYRESDWIIQQPGGA